MSSKFLCIGPGGRKCNCCFPAPGSRARRLEYRRAKRREERVVKWDIIEGLMEVKAGETKESSAENKP